MSETAATVAEIKLLQQLLSTQRKKKVMDILSTSLFATSVVGIAGGSSYLVASAIATGVLSGGLLPALGLVAGGCFIVLGRISK